MTTNMMDEAINEIRHLTGESPTFGGGGKGQYANLQVPFSLDGLAGGATTLTGKGASRYAAVVDLLHQVREARAAEDKHQQEVRDAYLAEPGDAEMPVSNISDDDFEPKTKARATVDDVTSALLGLFPGMEVIEEDDDRTPGPVWKDGPEGMVLISVVPCVGECMEGKSDVCDCRCMGDNHGLMRLVALDGLPTKGDVAELRPVRFGPKPCLCGCGGQTDRKFVPGHDARYHAAQKRERRAKAAGITLDELAEQDKTTARDKAKSRRAARREARAAATGAAGATETTDA